MDTRPPPPSYHDRYPEGRERLLALSEARMPGPVPPPTAKHPRMGLKGKPSDSVKAPSGLSRRPLPVYSSEASLPDKLSQALRGLVRPTPQKAPTGTVAADDVLYYAGTRNEPSLGNGTPRFYGPECEVGESSRSSEDLAGRHRLEEMMAQLRGPPVAPRKAVPPMPPPKPMLTHQPSSLDQLRELYRSMPDCSSLGRGGEVEAPNQDRLPPPTFQPLATSRILVNDDDESEYWSCESDYRQRLQATADKMLSSQRIVPPPSAFQPPPRATRKQAPAPPARNLRPDLAPSPPPSPDQPPPPPLRPPPSLTQELATPPANTPPDIAQVRSGGDSPTDSGYRSVPRHIQDDQENSKLSVSPADEGPLHSTPLKFPHRLEGGGSGTLDIALSMEELPEASPRLLPTEQRVNGDGLSSMGSPGSLEERDCETALSRRSSAVNGSPDEREGSKARNRSGRSQLVLNAGQSFETINTNVSLPEEFSLERCPQLADPTSVPWSEKDIINVLQKGRTKELVSVIAVEVVPRLSFLLRRPLVRLARETARFASRFGKASKRDAQFAVRVVLAGQVGESADKAGLTAAALYALSGADTRATKAARAGLRLPVGRLQRWLLDAQVGSVVLDQTAVFLAAALECILEELVRAAVPRGPDGRHPQEGSQMLTVEVLDAVIAERPEFWGLLQPYQHLINTRTAAGLLCLPSTWGYGGGSLNPAAACTSLWNSSHHLNGENGERGLLRLNAEQCLLATCVGTSAELKELIERVCEESELGSANDSCLSLPGSVSTHSSNPNLSMSGKASGWPKWAKTGVEALFHYMRCSQLQHGDTPPLLLAHERPYLVLPPLAEYLRVAVANCHQRQGTVVTAEDVLQAARLLLPHLDLPPAPFRPVSAEEAALSAENLPPSLVAGRRKQGLGFALLGSGRPELVPEAAELLGPRRLNTLSEQGLSPLMLAVLAGERSRVRLLLESGADLNLSVPDKADAAQWPGLMPELAGWTALTFAVASGDVALTQMLLEKGADVQLPAMRTETPLQMAAAMGSGDLVSLLLRCGADPYHSTLRSLNEASEANSAPNYRQKGSPPAISLAASHGHRSVLHLLIRKGQRGRPDESLSLADFLAEASGGRQQSLNNSPPPGSLGKAEMRGLSEALYHAAEAGRTDIALHLRSLGVPWTIGSWLATLAFSVEQRKKSLTQRLLADFTDRLFEDINQEFVEEGLPLLLEIFSAARSESVLSQLAAVLSHLYGPEPVPPIAKAQRPQAEASIGGGIDAAYVNNPELSDVKFRIQGRVFYAHRIVLANASPHLKTLITPESASHGVDEDGAIVIQDTTYDVFELMMGYLYRGGLETGKRLAAPSLLQLLAAANEYGLDGLARLCSSRIANFISLDNCLEIYRYAKNLGSGCSGLVAYCEGFMLQRLPAFVGGREVGDPASTAVSETFRKYLRGRRGGQLSSGLLTAITDRVQHRLNRSH